MPTNYHQYHNFCQLLEHEHILKLKRAAYDEALAEKMPVPPRFDQTNIQYGKREQHRIYQFVDFVTQILQVDPRKRLTPLQALAHPFITGEELMPVPHPPAPDYQLRQFREAYLSQFVGRQTHLPPRYKFNMQHFFATEVQQAQQNGPESFRPALGYLPEELFYGNCQEVLAKFLEESKIRFQIHQDDYHTALSQT